MLKAEQIRAARALIGWSQGELAKRVGVSTPAIGNIEIEKHKPNLKTQENIILAFDQAGIEFIDDGVRKKKSLIETFEGPRAIVPLFDDMINCLSQVEEDQRELLAFGADEEMFLKHFSLDTLNDQLERRDKLKIRQRLLICEGVKEIVGHLNTYRWMPKTFFASSLTYVYGDNVAFVLWQQPVQILLIRNAALAEERRKNFQLVWNSSRAPILKDT